ncbi:RING finger protein unkempt-like protein [Acropora cervicornis]|uniref:RING finger protein unkempt-like protein n=1 Tax=Acropora cervicornis TaxID=6130 RepID=A0AAD9V824_ACRCE|nr:RING finger protein unkempt-like protein [Acropora cervicornis]
MLWCARVWFSRPQNNMSSSDSVMTSPSTVISSENKLANFSQTQPEKPFHYTYLKEFRVEQCPLFLQHKCTAHRPFTCFHWHFMNQRRRRPKKKRDGTFNYSPDVYCTQYDETSGICPSGDDCPYLHRVAGDVERRYHLRYYKTATCVHETDTRGYCVKNGPHCAFAHGPLDLRQPVYDVRELQAIEKEETDVGQAGIENNKAVLEDPRWQDTNYVLSSYKTEPCKKPPRLCRQGYACPHYHNTRDRRRSPRKFRYRSTPCPHVKHGDEWGEPTNCESGDNCPYCHTRTEQQFHPEIYKSTKCNDMQQTGYCPRGPFCAFAHVDQDSVTSREANGEQTFGQLYSMPPSPLSPVDSGTIIMSSVSQSVGKQARSLSTSSAGSYSSEPSTPSSLYPKAPGSERSERCGSKEDEHQNILSTRQAFSVISSSSSNYSTVSANAPPFYPAADTVESVVESALDDFNLDDFDVSELEKELNNASPVSSTLGDPLSALNIAPMCSAPVTIPGAPDEGSNPYRASPLVRGSLHSSVFDPISTQLHSPKSLGSPQMASPLGLGNNSTEIQRLSEELMAAKTKLASWEESWVQAKQACDAWKKEAEESIKKAKQAEKDKLEAVIKKEEVMYRRVALVCSLCEQQQRCVMTKPCFHCTMCETCASQRVDCPICRVQISQKTLIKITI